MRHKVRRRYLLSFWLTYLCVAAGGAAQADSSDGAGEARLALAIDAAGAESVVLTLSDQRDSAPLAPTLGLVLGCTLQKVNEQEDDGDWIVAGRCTGGFRRHGLVVGGQIQFAPLLEVLRDRNMQWLAVEIQHPRAGFTYSAESNWKVETTESSVQYFYRAALQTVPRSPVRLAFGYLPQNFLPAAVLLLPIGLTLAIRWALMRLRKADATAVWFTYWSLLGWFMLGSWLLWVRSAAILDCAAVSRFLTNGSSHAVWLQIGFYVAPPFLVQLFCTILSGPVLERISGKPGILRVTLKHALWHEPVQLWPLLCFLAGVASIALLSEPILGAAFLVVGYLGRVGLVRLWLKFQSLDRYILPPGELRERILTLAQEADVKLVQIYLLPASEGRLDRAFMTRRKRLFLSDYLLRALRKPEVEAVVARELAHVKHHHRSVLLAASVLAVLLIYRFSHLPAVVSALPGAVRGPLPVWLAPLCLYLFWRHLERRAAAEAIAWTGQPEALFAALPKIARSNLLGMYLRKWEQRLLPRRSIEALAEVVPAPGAQAEHYVPPAGPDEEFLAELKRRARYGDPAW